jgi:DNA-binding response OmpR family regulator
MDEVFITPKQSELAEQFLERPNELLTYAYLMKEVWGTQYLGDTRTLHVHIHWLRSALEDLDVPFHIETVRGEGYRLITSPVEYPPEG